MEASVSRSTIEIQDDWPNASTVWSLDTSTETAGSLPGTTTGAHVLHWGLGTPCPQVALGISSQISCRQVQN